MEQLGVALTTEESRQLFRQDFLKMDAIVQRFSSPSSSPLPPSFLPPKIIVPGAPLEDFELYQQQLELSRILENAVDYQDVQSQLAVSNLANTAWDTEHWAPYMVETAMRIAQKWKKNAVR